MTTKANRFASWAFGLLAVSAGGRLAWELRDMPWELWAILGSGLAVGALLARLGARFQAMFPAMAGTMLTVAAILCPDAVLRLFF